MSYVPISTALNKISEAGQVDIKSIARDIYQDQLPRLLATWLDADTPYDDGINHFETLADKNSLSGTFFFSQKTQQYSDIFQSSFNIFNLQLKDVTEMAKMF